MRDSNGRTRPGRTALRPSAAAVAVVAAVACASCSFADVLKDPVHDKTRDYLRTVAEGGSPTAFYGDCQGRRDDNAHGALAVEGRDFDFSLTGSVESGDSADVNTSVTGPDGAPTSYVIHLRREGGTWFVCGVAEGNVDLGGAG